MMFRFLVLLQNVSHNHLLIIKQKIIFCFSTDKNDSKRNQFAFVHNTDNALNFIHDEMMAVCSIRMIFCESNGK